MRSDSCDEVDRQIAHAVQINARAPFSQIATSLGVSDQTVARRYTRLRSSGALHVRGLTDPYLGGNAPWVLRVRCAPVAAAKVAEALARRDDTAWVRLTSGGTEIVCMVAGHSGGGEALLLDRLPHTPRIEGVTAHHLLRTFWRGLHRLIAEHSGLTADQIRSLQQPETARTPELTALSDGDQLLLDALARDGRTGLADLAAATGWSRSTVSHRMTDLAAGGVLYYDVDVDQRLFPAITAWTVLWLSVEPAALETVGKALAEHPEVGYAAATTGPTNIYASVAGPNAPALYTYLTRRIAPLPGIRHMETAPVLHSLKSNR
ncbi:AsnC family transcriptional regulator [Actinomadura darangshiensis]|uniref:AsnC family transcriptional regulator n=1 Tax=Actinomadura darangshiensis TaxID=705336 RepID=A0A4R5BCC9_9ACTN|nr:AsnC family transcriptional regulator [Actinomadura darangshiensis]TDD81172.1 AsnC family transcriptional regulator [Actinomadura darangshiensis]